MRGREISDEDEVKGGRKLTKEEIVRREEGVRGRDEDEGK